MLDRSEVRVRTSEEGRGKEMRRKEKKGGGRRKEEGGGKYNEPVHFDIELRIYLLRTTFTDDLPFRTAFPGYDRSTMRGHYPSLSRRGT